MAYQSNSGQPISSATTAVIESLFNLNPIEPGMSLVPPSAINKLSPDVRRVIYDTNMIPPELWDGKKVIESAVVPLSKTLDYNELQRTYGG